MKRSTLKIGSKNARQIVQDGKRISVNYFTCQYNEPESVADCLKLAQGNEAELVKMFNRGYTIKLQDGVGRPMWEAGESQEAIQAELDKFVLGVSKTKGRPATPKVVTLTKGKKVYTPEEVAALLASSNIKAVTE